MSPRLASKTSHGPASAPAVSAQGRAGDPSGSGCAPQVRVLIVGRARAVREAVHLRLQAAGYTSVAARADRDAAEIASHEPYDAVVCVTMQADARPQRLLERLRERQSDACVIIVGPDPGAEQVALLLRAGAYDYVTTPLKAGRLEESLEQGLQMRRSFIEVRELSGKLQQSNEALAKEREDLRQWNRNLVLLNQLAQSITETLQADEIVRMVQSRLDQMVPYDVLGVAWLKPERVWVHSPHALDGAEQEEAKQSMLAQVQRLPLSVRYPSRSRELDLLGDPAPPPSRNEVAVPMMVGAGQVGLLRLERRGGQPFNEHEVELLKIVAGSLALALRNAEAHSHVQNLAMTDGLTNLLNRRAFTSYVAREFKETERYGTPLGLIMLDLDHFKAINDRHGHLTGDRLLKDVAALLTRAIRAMDIVTRYGGEEFAIILRRCDLPQALHLAERIRKKIEHHAFVTNGARIAMTISMGVVVVPDSHILSVDEFVAAADKSLYQAKTRGRNRVEVYDTAAAVGSAGAGAHGTVSTY